MSEPASITVEPDVPGTVVVLPGGSSVLGKTGGDCGKPVVWSPVEPGCGEAPGTSVVCASGSGDSALARPLVAARMAMTPSAAVPRGRGNVPFMLPTVGTAVALRNCPAGPLGAPMRIVSGEGFSNETEEDVDGGGGMRDRVGRGRPAAAVPRR